jgi:hypothetical protein
LGCIVLLHRLGSVELSIKALHSERYELNQLTIAVVIFFWLVLDLHDLCVASNQKVYLFAFGAFTEIV